MAPAHGCHRPAGGAACTPLGVVRLGSIRKVYDTAKASLRPASGSVVRVTGMQNRHTPSQVTMTEIIDGSIASVDRVYAFERIRAVCREAPRAVERARARLTAQPHPTGDSPATAECWLLLDGGLIVCAGMAASSVRDAVDGLMARLRRRLRIVDAERRSPRIDAEVAEPMTVP